RMAGTFSRIFGPQTQPSEQELDAVWTLIITHNGPAVMHRLIRYMAARPVHRDRRLSAMQQTAVPLRVIDGWAGPISGENVVGRSHQLIATADTVLLEGIGHYPQVEAPEQVLRHYLDFRDRL